MGMHWVDSTQSLVPGEYDFTQILINGTWDGRWTFIEPMMAIDWMRTKTPVQEDLDLPQAYQQSGTTPRRTRSRSTRVPESTSSNSAA